MSGKIVKSARPRETSRMTGLSAFGVRPREIYLRTSSRSLDDDDDDVGSSYDDRGQPSFASN